MEKAKVYFSKIITPEKLVEMYKVLGRRLKGRVAVKIHSGEPGGRHFISPAFMKGLVDFLNGAIVECNTAYEGRRFKTADHLQTLKEHGFTEIAPVDILDAEGDFILKVPNGRQIKKNYVGIGLKKYDSVMMLSHFKGHVMGGFGGALKNMSIGLASSRGKSYIHGAGKFGFDCEQDKFIEAMADADKSVMDYLGGNVAFINVMKDLSVDCDCDSHPAKPEMADIGILSSPDPVALDRACVDLVFNSADAGKAALIERIKSRRGELILEAAQSLGVGTCDYELIEI